MSRVETSGDSRAGPAARLSTSLSRNWTSLTRTVEKSLTRIVIFLGGLFFLSLFLLCISLLVNLVFRWLLLPRGPLQYKRALHFDYRLPIPTAVASFVAPESLAAECHDVQGSENSTCVYHSTSAGFLPSGHAYDVTVNLCLPESPVNSQVGTFMVTAELLTATGEVFASTFQPCMLKYRSWLVTQARSMFYMPFLALDFMEELQMHRLVMITSVLEQPGTELSSVKVALHPRHHQDIPKEHVIPQVCPGSEVGLDLKLGILLRLLKEYCIPTLVMGTTIVFVVLFVSSIVTLASIYFITQSDEDMSRDELSECSGSN